MIKHIKILFTFLNQKKLKNKSSTYSAKIALVAFKVFLLCAEQELGTTCDGQQNGLGHLVLRQTHLHCSLKVAHQQRLCHQAPSVSWNTDSHQVKENTYSKAQKRYFSFSLNDQRRKKKKVGQISCFPPLKKKA